jgi:hypothetical protein
VIYEPISAKSALETPPVRHWKRAVLGAAWHLIRLPVLTLPVILEPIVTLLCGRLALLGVLTTILFVVIHAPHFPEDRIIRKHRHHYTSRYRLQ